MPAIRLQNLNILISGRDSFPQEVVNLPGGKALTGNCVEHPNIIDRTFRIGKKNSNLAITGYILIKIRMATQVLEGFLSQSSIGNGDHHLFMMVELMNFGTTLVRKKEVPVRSLTQKAGKSEDFQETITITGKQVCS